MTELIDDKLSAPGVCVCVGGGGGRVPMSHEQFETWKCRMSLLVMNEMHMLDHLCHLRITYLIIYTHNLRQLQINISIFIKQISNYCNGLIISNIHTQ